MPQFKSILAKSKRNEFEYRNVDVVSKFLEKCSTGKNNTQITSHFVPTNKQNAVMQLLHEHKTLMAAVRDINIMSPNLAAKGTTSTDSEVKDNRSPDGSLLLMNPVASGDNVTTGLNSTHKFKGDLPSLVPCCEGRELQINEELVRTGLSAISVKHDEAVIQCLSMSRACEKMQVQPGLVKHRNSFRSLHRPDLKRVPYLRRMLPDELETLFRGYADFPVRTDKIDSHEEGRTSLPPNENIAKEVKKEMPRPVPDDGNAAITLRPIPETRSGTEDVPAGMRLHGARARLYTSVLAGATTVGDQLEGNSSTDEYEYKVPSDPLPLEDEIQMKEELQIILPPRLDDVTAESSTTTTTTDISNIS